MQRLPSASLRGVGRTSVGLLHAILSVPAESFVPLGRIVAPRYMHRELTTGGAIENTRVGLGVHALSLLECVLSSTVSSQSPQ